MTTGLDPSRRQVLQTSTGGAGGDSVRSTSGDRPDKSKKSTYRSDGWGSTASAKVVLALLCLGAVVVAGFELKSYFRGDTPGDPNTSMYVDAVTGQAFRHTNILGDTIPVLSPYTNARNGYPGLPCYWTALGEVKKDPDWVILNQELGKSGRTFCPVCGRLVQVGRLPPTPGDRPPPTRQELLHSVPSAPGATLPGR
jgi:hypothetical protein